MEIFEKSLNGGEEENRECPICRSKKNWKAGIRQTSKGEVQRFLCRNCGCRFSESSVKVDIAGKVAKSPDSGEDNHEARVASGDASNEKVDNSLPLFSGENVSSHEFSIVEKSLNDLPFYNSNHQVCAQKDAKNLNTTTETKTVAGERKIDNATARGLLLQYELWLQKQGYGKNCRYIDCIRMLINSGANPHDPENIKEVIAKKKWKNGTKMHICYAYDAMAKMLKLSWEKPTYKQEENLPFIPEAKEIDQLIASCRSKLVSTYLQTLKETMADPTEAIRLRWIDINFNENSIIINRPVKNHNPRKIPITDQLVSMLKILPRTSDLVFNTTYARIAERFRNYRRRAATNLQNPRLLSITLRTFRHFGATMLYAQTRDILLVMKVLGHKKIENTLKYTQLVNFKSDEFETATAIDLEEAKQLISYGFEYVTDMNNIKLFRKPKRFIA